VIVEFLEGGEFLLRFVISDKSGRLEVMVDGKTLRLVPQRVLNTLEIDNPHENGKLEAIIKEKSELRESFSREVDLLSLWELLEGEGEIFPYELLAELSFDKSADSDKISAVMRAVHRDGLYFKFSPEAVKRNSALEVLKINEERAREKEHKELILNGTIWLSESRIKASEGGALPKAPPNSTMLIDILKELALAQDEGQMPEKFLANMLSTAGFSPDPSGAFNALVAVGEFTAHENLDLLRLGLDLNFPLGVLEAAAELSKSTAYLSEDRLDLTGISALTIDAEGASEYDDALTLEPLKGGGFELGIHISDAAHLVKPSSPVDHFAAERGASIYMPEGRYSMLPPVLNDTVLSLSLDSVRPAFSLLISLSEALELLEYRFVPTLVKVTKQLSFNEADRILKEGGADKEKLLKLSQISSGFLKRRLAGGGFSFNLPATQVSIGPEGPQIVLNVRDTPATMLVGELMILANHLAAYTLWSNNFPCPYRYQQLMKSPQGAISPKGPKEKLCRDLTLRRRLGRSGISAEPSRHRGLGQNYYTYFTSPMRRYFDLLVHRQLRALSKGSGPFYDEKTLMGKAIHAEELLRAIHKAQNNRQRYFVLLELQKYEGQLFTLLAFDRQGKKVRLCLEEYMVETENTDLPHEVMPGDEVLGRLLVSDPRKRILKFEFVELLKRA
jgi:exoribonuclease-2